MLSVDDVCALHAQIIAIMDGRPGILNIKSLESAISNVYQTFDGEDLYPTVFDKAGQLFYALIKNHAFEDGNKRTAILVLQYYLNLNNYKLYMDDDELADLALKTAKSEYGVPEIKAWIEAHI